MYLIAFLKSVLSNWLSCFLNSPVFCLFSQGAVCQALWYSKSSQNVFRLSSQIIMLDTVTQDPFLKICNIQSLVVAFRTTFQNIFSAKEVKVKYITSL